MSIIALYVDGGVIVCNPSMIGGTYAWRLICDDQDPIGAGAVLTTHEIGGPVSNNQTEMMAMLIGLQKLPSHFCGSIYSDSQVTLGRVFMGWKWKNIPSWMHKIYQEQRARLTYWDQIEHILLAGHPTKAQLQAGIGKHGHPVSEHNVWCDEACRKAGEAFLSRVESNIPSTVEMRAA